MLFDHLRRAHSFYFSMQTACHLATALQTSKKPNVEEQKVKVYTDALEQLIDLRRVPVPGDVFAPLKTRGESP